MDIQEIPGSLPEDLYPIWAALTLKQRHFIMEYVKDGNATQAAYRAGYSRQSGSVTASKMMTRPNIKAVLQAMGKGKRTEAQLKVVWFVDECRKNYDRCMQASPVTDRNGKVVDGVWKYDAVGAHRFLELIGKAQNLFGKRTVKGESPEARTDDKYANIPPPPKDIVEWTSNMQTLGYDVQIDDKSFMELNEPADRPPSDRSSPTDVQRDGGVDSDISL